MSHSVETGTPPRRRRLLDAIDPRVQQGRVSWMIAPMGYGKSRLLADFAAVLAEEGVAAAYVSVEACERHAGLFRRELASQLRRVRPKLDLRPLLSGASETDVADGLRELLAGRAGLDSLVLLVDDVHLLAAGDPLASVLEKLGRTPPAGLYVVLAGDAPASAPAGIIPLRRAELELTVAEVEAYLASLGVQGANEPLAQRIWDRSHGWPTVVELIGVALLKRGDDAARDEDLGVADLGDELLSTLLSGLRPEVQYFARVASVLEVVTVDRIQTVLSGNVSGSPEARRRLIRLAPESVRRNLQQLEDAQLMTAAGDWLLFNPALRAALRRSFVDQDRDGYREANRRVAEILLAAGSPPDAAALDHLVEAGEHERIEEILALHAEHYFQLGYTEQLSTWLGALAKHYASPPHWVDYYLGRVASQRGDWGRAKRHLDRAKQSMERAGNEVSHWRWQPRLALGYASMMVRRGVYAEARTYCTRGLETLALAVRRGQVDTADQSEADTLRLRLSTLLGKVVMEVGTRHRAEEVLLQVLDEARSTGHDELAPGVLACLALNAARARDADAVQGWWSQGVEAAGEAMRHRQALGQLETARARMELCLGNIDACERHCERALAIHRADRDAAGHAAALGVRARLDDLRGDHAAAGAAFERGLEAADRVGKADVQAELLDRAALHFNAVGDSERAQAMHERAASLIGPILRMDGYLGALHTEVTAELRLAREKVPNKGIRYVDVARESYARFGAPLDVGRLHWRESWLHHQRVMDGDDEARQRTIEHLGAACALASGPRDFLLQGVAEPDALLVVGAQLGDEETIAFCQASLVERGVELAALDARLSGVSARYDALLTGHGSGTPYRLVSREPARPCSQRDYDALYEGDGTQALIVFVDDRSVLNFGKRITLGQKRVILPLLLHFLRHPDEAFSMSELAKLIWEADEVSASIQTKVKVAVSRLRSLLGKSRNYIITTRKQQEGASVVAYAVAPTLSFLIVEPA